MVFPTSTHACWAILVLGIAGAAEARDPLLVTIELGSPHVAINDCQIARVSVTNITSKPVTLDSGFGGSVGGPAFSMRRGDEPIESVLALGQGTGLSTRRSVVILPAQQWTYFGTLLQRYWQQDEDSEKAEKLIFHKPGEYGFRAGVTVAGRTIWSEEATCEALEDSAISWELRRGETLLSWRYPSAHYDDVANKMPAGSVAATIGFFGVACKAVRDGVDVDRTAWAELKGTQSEMLSDFAAEGLAIMLLSQKRYKEALSEVATMKIKTRRAINVEEEAKMLLERLKNPPERVQ